MSFFKNLWAKAKAYVAKKFPIVEDWRIILRHSISVWLAVGAALLGGIEYLHADVLALLPIVTPFLPEKLAGALGTLLAAAIPLARIRKQVSIEIAKARQLAKDREEITQ